MPPVEICAVTKQDGSRRHQVRVAGRVVEEFTNASDALTLARKIRKGEVKV